MSTNSVLKARLARQAPVRDAASPSSFSGAPVSLVLRLTGAFGRRLSVLARLRAAGLSLQAAHAAITRLAEAGTTVCVIAEGADIPALARDLGPLDVAVLRAAPRDPGDIAAVRARHGLSQREFAALLGIDPDTLRNWEQGRNKPDAAALALVRVYDAAPDLVTAAVLEPAG
ncbi:MAG: helix-turn-helix domain-containing protein [Rhodospirillales bacterium]|nr:helix-turn-helix domain-containing protein [Rhodospirillales bacterium]